ncbi:DUF4331 family protein [Aurantiacibacter rhizosphaerae]|uniref:DUF4331 domain-containing protein n=1 Tax=Aurantiacibacter rhizosphaerae TaxID=2691582 RepID=A0A844XCS3_9SPHN|nr:DUF4331 family protein [Aurantiacibacter rhizosphaerae]MWV27563.1 DUF4331 domain-containing protein [Aurantiacibacter rhizosphaerae]
MRRNAKLMAGAAGLVLAIGATQILPGLGLTAADHLDPPGRTDPSVDSTPDRAADIADIFAWHTDDKFNMVLTFSGPQATDEPATYDPDVLYQINISNAGSRVDTEIPIRVRFGRGAMTDEFGVQVSNVPGVTGNIVGSVEKDLTKDGVMVRAGLFDDPFFFDLQGFMETKDTGDLSFMADRDFFAGQNLTAIVISIPLDRIANGDNLVDVWAETARFGGQL